MKQIVARDEAENIFEFLRNLGLVSVIRFWGREQLWYDDDELLVNFLTKEGRFGELVYIRYKDLKMNPKVAECIKDYQEFLKELKEEIPSSVSMRMFREKRQGVKTEPVVLTRHYNATKEPTWSSN